MKITILNGNPTDQNTGFEQYLDRLTAILTAQQHAVTRLNLREMEMSYCIGCFGCWVKTPGECRSADESAQVCRTVINSNFTLWAAPLQMGFPSALLKKAMDKSIPLIHPYIVVDHNEAHHLARYAHYPRLGLLLQKEDDTDSDDLRIVADVFSRTALNMKSRLDFVHSTDQPVEALAAAITIPSRRGIKPADRLTPTSGIQIAPPKRLTVFNGSPRGRKGNTPLMLEQFLKGFTDSGERTFELYHLNRLKETERFQQAFADAEGVLLGFPLYTDAMPGIVKAFIETLTPFQRRAGNPPIGFLVQSGFPEAAHSRHIERYLEKLADRLGSPYLGTMVKGGGEGIRIMPERMTRDLFHTLYQLGKTFGERGRFESNLLQQLAKPERYPAVLAPFFQVFLKTRQARWYWDMQLKENEAFEQRFAKPYAR
ncbi:MAG TPA: NAD(P)H-dependent oxidoreductase [Anaerolineae bacterium]|nr:NAD(P)H-dependent oxidoreductase [Anaerolineae bacterium]